MEFGELKPLLSTLVLPPAGPLLLAALGTLITCWKRAAGIVVTLTGLALLWLLSCNAVAVWLSQTILPQVPPLPAGGVRAAGAQAIVVLGGGVQAVAPEYGEPQPAWGTATRLRYGVTLAKQSQLPLAFAGGVGWANAGTGTASEGEVAHRVAQADYGVTLRWVDDKSRDTAESARVLAPMLKTDGYTRIALVTSAWHMPRAVQAFERAGFTVVAAPTGYVLPIARPALEWLPSAGGLQSSQVVLREWLGLVIARI